MESSPQKPISTITSLTWIGLICFSFITGIFDAMTLEVITSSSESSMRIHPEWLRVPAETILIIAAIGLTIKCFATWQKIGKRT